MVHFSFLVRILPCLQSFKVMSTKRHSEEELSTRKEARWEVFVLQGSVTRMNTEHRLLQTHSEERMYLLITHRTTFPSPPRLNILFTSSSFLPPHIQPTVFPATAPLLPITAWPAHHHQRHGPPHLAIIYSSSLQITTSSYLRHR